MSRSSKSRKQKIKPWILDYVKAKLGCEGNTKWDGRRCIAKIKKIESNTSIIVSDGEYYIKCHVLILNENENENEHRLFRPNILLNIKQSNIEINSSFNKLHLLLNAFSFDSLIPILSFAANAKQPMDINKNKVVQNVIVIRRRKGIIFRHGMGDILYVRGKYDEYCYAINKLAVMYYDIMFLIASYKNGKGFVSKREKKKIRNDFRILAEWNININININDDNYNGLLEYYELVSADLNRLQFDEKDLLNILCGKAAQVIHTNSRWPKAQKKKESNVSIFNYNEFENWTAVEIDTSSESDTVL